MSTVLFEDYVSHLILFLINIFYPGAVYGTYEAIRYKVRFQLFLELQEGKNFDLNFFVLSFS